MFLRHLSVGGYPAGGYVEPTPSRAAWVLQNLIKDAHLVARRYEHASPLLNRRLQRHTNLILFSLRFDVDCQPQPDSPPEPASSE